MAPSGETTAIVRPFETRSRCCVPVCPACSVGLKLRRAEVIRIKVFVFMVMDDVDFAVNEAFGGG